MDFLLSKVTQQAMNYAIRSGITITSGYAVSQCSRLMKTQDGREREELQSLQRRLDSKIRIISPAIDMIELITARGNTSLESCVSLTKALRLDIQDLGNRLANAAADEEASKRKSAKASSKFHREQELKVIVAEMKLLLQRLEDAVPLINLAITTSGVSLSTTLPASISPSRLLQASTFLSAGDAAYSTGATPEIQIGPTFTLSMYMLFLGHANQVRDEEGLRQATWQEVIHKARVKLVRTSIPKLGSFAAERSKSELEVKEEPTSPANHMPGTAWIDEFAYQLTIVEDLEDDRVHTFEEDEPQPGPFDGTPMAGIREIVPVHEIAKIFYADTGKILNINSEGESNSPVLLLKRDVAAAPPRRMMAHDIDGDGVAGDASGEDDFQDASTQFGRPDTTVSGDSFHSLDERRAHKAWQLPHGLDPEWIALEVYAEEPDDDSDSESLSEKIDSSSPAATTEERRDSLGLSDGVSNLQLSPSPAGRSNASQTYDGHNRSQAKPSMVPHPLNAIVASTSNAVRTSLSLLEMLIRLTSLQQFQQASHLTINDELLNFFLEESSTTGAACGDSEDRKRIRLEARQKVGFDPYNESPIKRRGEQYQQSQSVPGSPVIESRASTPSRATSQPFDSSPLVTKSRHHVLRSQSSSSSPSRPNVSSPTHKTPNLNASRQSFASLATPPGTTKSREQFLREESASNISRSSPLAMKARPESPGEDG